MEENNRRSFPIGYVTYIGVASLVGIITILIRQFLGYVFGEDNFANYGFSVLCAYSVGVVLSYIGQAKFTFKKHPMKTLTAKKMGIFVTISIFASIAATLLAGFLRYSLGFDRLFGGFSPNIAFICAVLLISFISYYLNARLIFANKIDA